MSFLDVLVPDKGPVFKNHRVVLEADAGGKTFAYGGLALAHDLVGRLKLPQLLDERVEVFKKHRPYHESDHILTHVYNLYAGGDAIEDIANLQNSEAFRNMVGAQSVPDPSTAGDFLRRLRDRDLRFFQAAIDEARKKVWKKLPRSERACLTVDMDSTIKPVFGECKNGADFSYTGKWSYHPLVISTAETKECLRLINRSGNVSSPQGAALALDECLGMARPFFRQLRVRGDSAFYQEMTIRTAEAHGAQFAFVMDSVAGVRSSAAELPEQAWKPLVPIEPQPTPANNKPVRPRRKREKLRRKKAQERGYRTLHTRCQWVAQFRYRPSFATRDYRVVVKRQLIEETQGQAALIERYEYRFLISNIESGTPAELVHFAYGRCEQENTIEQLKNGIAAMRMPTGELEANAAFMLAAELAWNLRAWLCLLALPRESRSWEWKRFRHAFLYLSAKITRTGGNVVARIAASHRFVDDFVAARQRLAAYNFA